LLWSFVVTVVKALRSAATKDDAGKDAAQDDDGSNYVALLEEFHNADTDNDGKLYKDVRTFVAVDLHFCCSHQKRLPPSARMSASQRMFCSLTL